MLIFSFLLLLGFEYDMPYESETITENRTYNVRLACDFNHVPSIDSLLVRTKKNKDTVSYSDTKTQIGILREHLGDGHKQGSISLDSIKAAFTNHLVNRIIPHWYGTPWSFGGHTATPNQGEIACGYFISTTLRDMGIKLNRYKLAQKSPIDEAKVISCGSPINSIIQENPEKAIEEIHKLTKEGLHFIGFDTGHVGYLLKQKGQLFLIHSNYYSPVSVCLERIEDSRAFKSFTKFHIVDISNNDVLIQRWLENGTVL